MPPDAQVLHLVQSYNAASARSRTQTLTFVGQSWSRLGSWRDEDVDGWVARVTPAVRGGQRRIASLVDGYLATMESVVLGKPARPLGVPGSVLDGLRDGTPPADVYRRAGVATWTALAAGAAFADAVNAGRDRALVLAASDLQLAKTTASRYVLSKRSDVAGYRRVLNSDNPCDLCSVASDQTYHRDDLMPIHPGCDCGVEPIFRTDDPGTLDAGASSAFEGTTVAVHEHGELGPLLTVAGQAFTGPDDF